MEEKKHFNLKLVRSRVFINSGMKFIFEMTSFAMDSLGKGSDEMKPQNYGLKLGSNQLSSPQGLFFWS